MDPATTTPDTATPPLPPPAAPPNFTGEQGGAGGGEVGSAPAANTPSSAPAVTPAVTAVDQPVVIQPSRRTGLAGIVDQIRDAIAGTDSTKVYTDNDGNKYIQHEHPTKGQQWLRIAGTVAHGAAAGLAAGRGRGNAGNAALAGINAGQQDQDRRAQQTKDQQQQVRQATLDKFNSVKLQHDVAASEFALSRMKVQATQEDVRFSQEQIDREHALGSADLGTYKDPLDLSKVQQQDPDFWKNVYSGNIHLVPELDENGERQGIHVFLRTPGINDQLVPEGSRVMDFMPGEKPGDAPRLVPRTLTSPTTHKQQDDINNAALAKYDKWNKDQADVKDKAAQEELRKAQTGEAKANTVKARAEAGKADADAAQTRAIGAAGDADQAKVDENIKQGLANGTYLIGKDIPLRTSKGQRGADFYTAGADAYSRQHFGLPYSPELIRQEAKFAESPKTQAFLTGIDRMVGTPDIPGQLDQVLDLAKKAGMNDDTAPVNTVGQWMKRTLGNDAAKRFYQALSDTQTAMGTLIGNPLLGGGESDLKLKTAQGQFGKDATLGNLKGAAATAKEILGRAKQQMARNNRYIQQRYGESYSPQAQTEAAAPQRPAGVPAQAVWNPNAKQWQLPQ
jgi:hypothetical protein